jgi:hypothetical protein
MRFSLRRIDETLTADDNSESSRRQANDESQMKFRALLRCADENTCLYVNRDAGGKLFHTDFR